MKNGRIVEKILFVFLLIVSGGVAHVVFTRSNMLSSDNSLLLLLALFWIIMDYALVKKIVKSVYFFSKKVFHFSGKRKLHQV